MAWGKKDCQRLMHWYQDETGIMVFKLADVVEWAKSRNVQMPVPPSPEKLLERKLAAAARADRRSDPGLATDYRGTLAYGRTVDGQEEFYWFDVDGPGATIERMQKAQKLRREGALNVCVQIGATDRHWNATHPEQGALQTDFNLADEVTWRLNGPVADVEADKNAG